MMGLSRRRGPTVQTWCGVAPAPAGQLFPGNALAAPPKPDRPRRPAASRRGRSRCRGGSAGAEGGAGSAGVALGAPKGRTMHLHEQPEAPRPGQRPISTGELILRAGKAITAARTLARETAAICEESRLLRET